MRTIVAITACFTLVAILAACGKGEAGTFYSTVNAFDLTTLGSSTTPTFQNSWTCNDLGGKSLQTVSLPQGDQELVKELTACFNGIGLDDSAFIQSCSTAAVCSTR